MANLLGEAQFDVIEFLKLVPSHGFVSVDQIKEKTGVDLDGDYKILREKLKTNPKVVVKFEEAPISQDGLSNDAKISGTCYFAYRSRFDIKNQQDLIDALNNYPYGLSLQEIEDCYASIKSDIAKLTISGEIIIIKDVREGRIVLFPRGQPFLTRLSGLAAVTGNSSIVRTTEDITKEIRRGDSIAISPHVPDGAEGDVVANFGSMIWSKVSAASTSSTTASFTAASAHAAKDILSRPGNFLSTTSVRDPPLGARARYIYEYNNSKDDGVPLDRPVAVTEAKRAIEEQRALAEAARERQKAEKGANDIDNYGSRQDGDGSSSGSGSPFAFENEMQGMGQKNHHHQNHHQPQPQQRSIFVATGLSLLKHGCTNDIRHLWHETRHALPRDDHSGREVQRRLVQHSLLDGRSMAAQDVQLQKKARMQRIAVEGRMKKAMDRRAKKRAYTRRRNVRLTNTHLMETEMGKGLENLGGAPEHFQN